MMSTITKPPLGWAPLQDAEFAENVPSQILFKAYLEKIFLHQKRSPLNYSTDVTGNPLPT